MFVAEPAANFVRRIILEDDGTTLRARNAYDKAEFLGSTDERFRPVFLSNAPDGTLMVVDFYRGVIQDRASTTVYLKDYIQKRKLDAPTGVGLGRVYRVVHDSVQRDPTPPQLSRATPAQLVQALSHPNGWWRDTAQRLLVERGVEAVVAELKALATGAAPPAHARERALGARRHRRASTSRPSPGRWRTPRATCAPPRCALPSDGWATPNSPVQAAVLKLIDDPDWQVREQLAASLGALPAGPRKRRSRPCCKRYGDDAVTMDAALSGARGSEPAAPGEAAAAGCAPDGRARSGDRDGERNDLRAGQDAVGADHAGGGRRCRTVRRGSARRCFAAPRSRWCRTRRCRATRGAAPRHRSRPPPWRRGAPCPTCPGGRAGPGGAYAFDDARGQAAGTPTLVARGARAGGAGGRGGGRGGGPRLELVARAVAVRGARGRLRRSGVARGERARQDRLAGKAGAPSP